MKLKYFSSPRCGPCKLVSPMIDKLKSERTDLSVEKIDVTNPENYDEVKFFAVMSVPTIICLDSNNRVLSKNVGAIGYSQLERIIKNNS